MKEGRKPEYPEKTADDELQKSSVSQGRICAYTYERCSSEIEAVDQYTLPHSVTVCWHLTSQSQHWPYNSRRLAG